MMTHRYTLSLLAAVAPLLLLLGGCRQSAPSGDPSQPGGDPSTTTEGDKIILDEPVVLTLGVFPQRTIDPSRPCTRALSPLSRDYSDAERQASTINSSKPTEAEDYRGYSQWYIEGGTDWVHTLVIPELEDYEYKVEGLIPSSIVPSKMETVEQQYRAVRVTLYKLPAARTLTFLANADQPGMNTFGESDKGFTYDIQPAALTLEDPYCMVRGWYRLDERTAQFYDPAKAVGKESIQLLPRSDYLPMFGRLTDVTSLGEGKISASQFGEAESEVEHIYLERSVAQVQVFKDNAALRDGVLVPHVEGMLLDVARPGRYVNVLSIVPNNWDGIQEIRRTRTRPSAATKIDYLQEGWSDNTTEKNSTVDLMLRNNPVDSFFITENYPSDTSEQSTMWSYVTYFDPVTHAITERYARRYSLLFGHKGPSGLYEIHRNTQYRLHIKFKASAEGPVPYIVDPWEDQDVDIPW